MTLQKRRAIVISIIPLGLKFHKLIFFQLALGVADFMTISMTWMYAQHFISLKQSVTGTFAPKQECTTKRQAQALNGFMSNLLPKANTECFTTPVTLTVQFQRLAHRIGLTH